jgi:hypothetical protein
MSSVVVMKSSFQSEIENFFSKKINFMSKLNINFLYQKSADIYQRFSFLSDLDWIQTSNLLSRNQVRYSVAPRGRFEGANILFFTNLQTIFCNKISPANYG